MLRFESSTTRIPNTLLPANLDLEDTLHECACTGIQMSLVHLELTSLGWNKTNFLPSSFLSLAIYHLYVINIKTRHNIHY